MPYQYDLSPNQKIHLDNLGPTTVITLASGGPGQQQQSGNRVQTGAWTEVPQAAETSGGVLIRCVTAQGVFVWQVQGNQIESANAAAWSAQKAVSLKPAEAGLSSMPPMPPMEPMQPMAPMQPMKMGNMEMSANPMTMRMGDMTLSMGNTNTPDTKKFCTQCGSAVDPGDRFCGNCGHQLQEGAQVP